MISFQCVIKQKPTGIDLKRKERKEKLNFGRPATRVRNMTAVSFGLLQILGLLLVLNPTATSAPIRVPFYMYPPSSFRGYTEVDFSTIHQRKHNHVRARAYKHFFDTHHRPSLGASMPSPSASCAQATSRCTCDIFFLACCTTQFDNYVHCCKKIGGVCYPGSCTASFEG